MEIRKAIENDIEKVEKIYLDILSVEEEGKVSIGWVRGIYPTCSTAEAAIERDDLFILEDEGEVIGTAIINKVQVDVYAKANWKYPAPDSEIMVLHTLVISPFAARKGYGRSFVDFYEKYALCHNCHYLRMDTNEKNVNARALYKKLGYEEIGILPTVFNGLEGVQLVLLEKKLVD